MSLLTPLSPIFFFFFTCFFVQGLLENSTVSTLHNSNVWLENKCIKCAIKQLRLASSVSLSPLKVFVVFTLTQFFLIPPPKSHHQFIDVKLMSSSSISLFDNKLDWCISSFVFHDEGVYENYVLSLLWHKIFPYVCLTFSLPATVALECLLPGIHQLIFTVSN